MGSPRVKGQLGALFHELHEGTKLLGTGQGVGTVLQRWLLAVIEMFSCIRIDHCHPHTSTNTGQRHMHVPQEELIFAEAAGARAKVKEKDCSTLMP